MRFLRYIYNNLSYWGISSKDLPDDVYALEKPPFEDISVRENKKFLLKDLVLLPPSLPSKIVAVGLNYIDHARELNMSVPDEPVLFLKPPSSVIGPYENIIIPEQSKQVDYEAELAVVIGKVCKKVSVSSAMDYVLGFTCFNDITARDLQKKDGQWTRAKSFDTFSAIGPFIVTPDEFEYNNTRIKCIVNGKIKQDSTTANLIFNVQELISFISYIMTLFPGDIITTGTPPGVGPLKSGDTVEISIDGIGSLINRVL